MTNKNSLDQAAEVHCFADVCLELVTKDAMMTVSVGLGLHDEATGARYTATQSSKMEFNTRCVEGFVQVRCINRFMRRTELESSPFLRDDRLVIECSMSGGNTPAKI